MNLNWVALFSLAIKYGPGVIAFIQAEGPQIRAFIADVEAALQSGSGPIGLFPLLMRYGPAMSAFMQQEQAVIETFVKDVELALQPPKATPILKS